eukprot:Skav227559  [mRNA]  locus=scaffold3241:169042:170574:+ [translate_table: standard]
MALLVVKYNHEGDEFKRVLFNRALKGFDEIDLTVMPPNGLLNKSNIAVLDGLTKKSLMEFLFKHGIFSNKDDDKNALIDKLHTNWNDIFDDIAGVMGIDDVSQSISLSADALEEGEERGTGLIFIKDNAELFAIKSSKVAGIGIVDVQEPASAVYRSGDVQPAMRHITKVAMEKFLGYFGLKQRNYKKEDLPAAIEALWDARIKPNLRPFFPMAVPADPAEGSPEGGAEPSDLQSMLNTHPAVIELNTHPSEEGSSVEAGTVQVEFDRDGIATCFFFHYVKETIWGELYDALREWGVEIGAYDEEDYNLTLERKGSFTISYETISSWGLPMADVLEMNPHIRLCGGGIPVQRLEKTKAKVEISKRSLSACASKVSNDVKAVPVVKKIEDVVQGFMASLDTVGAQQTLLKYMTDLVKASPQKASEIVKYLEQSASGSADVKIRHIAGKFFGCEGVGEKIDELKMADESLKYALLIGFQRMICENKSKKDYTINSFGEALDTVLKMSDDAML